MGFEAPGLLWGLALLGVPVLLHFLMKDRPRDLPFPTLRFLREAVREQTRRLRFRHLFLLLVRMLVLLLFVLALARPRIRWSDTGGAREGPVDAVFVVDNSFSMTARLGEVTLLDEARQRAAAAAEDLPAGSRFSLASLSGGPAPFTLRPVEFRAEVEGLDVEWAGASLEGALAATARSLADRGSPERPAEVYLFTDGTRRALPARALEAWPPEVPLHLVDLAGRSAPNFYLAGLTLTATRVSPGSTVEIRGSVAASGVEGPRVVDLVVGGATKGSRSVEVRPGRPAPFSFSLVVERPGVLQGEVRLREDDPLSADNVRYFSIHVEEARSVVLVMDDEAYVSERLDGKWLALVLALDPVGDRRRVSRAGRRPRDLSEEGLAGCKVVVLPDVGGLDETAWGALRRFVTAGGGLLILPGPGTQLAELAHPSALELLPADVVRAEPLSESARPVDLDPSHPVLAAFADGANGDLPSARFRFILHVEPRPDAKVALRFDGGGAPAWIERTYGSGKVVLFTGGCHPDWTDFPRHLSFLPFLHETIRWLSGDAASGEEVAAGTLASIPLPPKPRRLRLVLVGPRARSREVALAPGQAVARPRLGEGPGHYGYVVTARDRSAEAEASGELPIRSGFSANVDPAESDLERIPAGELESALAALGAPVEDGASFQARIAGQERWASLVPILLVLALGVLTLENYLSNFFYR